MLLLENIDGMNIAQYGTLRMEKEGKRYRHANWRCCEPVRTAVFRETFLK